MNIVGISAFFHDSASCILCDGRLVAAAAEERFSRRKHDASLPARAFAYCLQQAGLTLADVDCVAYYEDPVKKLTRQLWMLSQRDPSKTEAEELQLDAGRVEREIRDTLQFDGRLEFVEHHQSHAASAFFFSGFPESAILTVDGVGEWTTTAYGAGSASGIDLFEEVAFPHSLGLLYTAITTYLGFDANDSEYKVMGLAPYGRPHYVNECRTLIRSCRDSGAFTLDMDYFDFVRGGRMYSERLCRLFRCPPRSPESEIAQFHKDIARSLQFVLEEILLEKAQYLLKRTAQHRLCMAGGVALNCVANGRILRESGVSELFVQPAADDSGGALGAAALVHYRSGASKQAPIPRLAGVRLGPQFGHEEICRRLDAMPLNYRDFHGREEDLAHFVAGELASGSIVGWFQGAMEFGPRALGGRSILADPRDASMRERINALVKKREAFRPFAPAVLTHRAAEHFDLDRASPYMLLTCAVRSPIPLGAITHIDGSARVQTVDATEERFHRLLLAFERRTTCPMLLNTSFNVRGEPIVCNPSDAIICFVRARLDLLVLEDCVICSEDVPPAWRHLVDNLPPPSASGVSHDFYTF